MRILLVSEDIPYPNMGGLAKHVLTLARALVRAGHEVDLLGGDQHPIEVAGSEGQFGGRFFGELNGHLAGWKEIQLGVYLPPKRTWIARRFARLIMRHASNYDVVHYHGHIPNVALFIPQTVNFVQTRHDHGSECLANTRFRNDSICRSIDPYDCAACRTPAPNPLQRAVSAAAVTRYREEVAESFQRHKTVFVSDMLQRNFSRALGPGSWGQTVHNFVDTAQLKRAREEAGLLPPSDKFDVFVAAKLYPAKGVEAFLRALVPQLPAGMRVTIAGDGPDEARLRAEYEGKGVRLLGWCQQQEVLRLSAAAAAIVVPSLWEEPFGTTLLEGLLLGKPTFALACGGTPEMNVYAEAGQLRLHDDMNALVRDLLSFDPGRKFMPPSDERGSVDHAVKKLLRIYRAPTGHTFS
jgi:glycosyltransferase involved in cell wall biosynthesis